MNYRELCQDFVRELGIAGGEGPVTVTNQVGELRNVVRWIAEAALWIDNLWADWRYLWFAMDATVATRELPPPPDGTIPRRWNRNAVWVNYGTGQARQLKFLEYDEFNQLYLARPQTNAVPSRFTIRPDNKLMFNCTPATAIPVHVEGWRRPIRLVENTDTPAMPADFHRIIVARAAIMYGNREAAGEIISGMEAEYADLLEKLQSDQLVAFAQDRMAGQDLPLAFESPGGPG